MGQAEGLGPRLTVLSTASARVWSVSEINVY